MTEPEVSAPLWPRGATYVVVAILVCWFHGSELYTRTCGAKEKRAPTCSSIFGGVRTDSLGSNYK